MTPDEARKILLCYRPGTKDAAEPEVAEALALAKQDPDLSLWLEQQCAQQQLLRAKIRQIPVPAGLKEQIISERVRYTQKRFFRQAVAMAAGLALVLLAGWRLTVFFHAPPADDTFA